MMISLIEILCFSEDGRLKYKVCFEEKGKSLVSGHHIAFDNTPKLEQLYVGARVVVRCQDNKFRFRPGVLAELPSRKNRLRCVFEWVFIPTCMNHQKLCLLLEEANTSFYRKSKCFGKGLIWCKTFSFSRFLVFMDDHTPIYVGLPLFHLVCRPRKFGLLYCAHVTAASQIHTTY